MEGGSHWGRLMFLIGSDFIEVICNISNWTCTKNKDDTSNAWPMTVCEVTTLYG